MGMLFYPGMMRDGWWGQSVGFNNLVSTGGGFGAGVFFGILILAAVVWTLYWKYRAMWHAAKHDRKIWFGVFILVNTLGILEILYLYVLHKYKKTSN